MRSPLLFWTHRALRNAPLRSTAGFSTHRPHNLSADMARMASFVLLAVAVAIALATPAAAINCPSFSVGDIVRARTHATHASTRAARCVHRSSTPG